MIARFTSTTYNRVADVGIPGGLSGRSGDFQPLSPEEESANQAGVERELLTECRQAMVTLEQEADAFVNLPPEPPIGGRLDFWKNEYRRRYRQEPTEKETERRNGGTPDRYALPTQRENRVNIYVGHLPRQATEDDVREAFQAFGQVASVAVIKDRDTRASRGFGFVEMPSQEEAQAAITGLNDTELMGSTLNVNEARPRPEGSGGERSGRDRRSG